MNDISMMTNMAMSKATQGNYSSHQNKAMASLNEQDATKKKQELGKAAEGFEAIFIQKMWEQMRASIPENAYLGSKEEKYWQSMYDQELGKSMAAGGGIGLADLIVQQMSKERVTSPSTSNLSMGKAAGRQRMEVEPAPLFANENVATQENVKANISNVQNQAVQNTTLLSNTNDLYESYDNQLEISPALHNNQNRQTLQSQNFDNINFAPQMGEDYKIAMAQSGQGLEINKPVQTNSVTSPTVAKALSELEAMVNPPQPTVVKTTYTTNLPASERKNAILDKKGNLTSEHKNMVEQNHKSMQKTQNIAPVVQGEAIQHNEYPEELITAPLTPRGNENFDRANQSLNQNRNILDGIQTRYRSTALPNPSIQQFLANNMAYNYPTVEEVQAEIDKLLGKEKSPPMIMAQNNLEAEPQKQNNIYQVAENVGIKPVQDIEITKLNQSNILLNPNLEKAMGGPNLEQPEQIAPQNISAVSPNLSLQSPLEGSLESVFGWRLDPFTQQRAWHNGIDIKAEQGSLIKAAASGVVSFVGEDPELGQVVIIDHENGLQSVYGHNSELLVQEGENISAGTDIAKVGMSGRATGPHLHFEIRDNGLSINPEPYLSKSTA